MIAEAVSTARVKEEQGAGAWLDRLVDESVFTPIRQGSAVAEAVARLGQAIAAGLLRPGDRLPTETHLAAALGISAVTLRSALTILRQGGLLETRRGRGGGTVVAARAPAHAREFDRAPLPSPEELKDLAEFRCVVEGGAAALAAELRTDGHLAELRRQIQAMEQTEDFSVWSSADTLFHLVIADACASPRLRSAVTELRIQSMGISCLYEPVPIETMRHSNAQHREILKALKVRRPERARELTVRHIQSTYDLWVGLHPTLAPENRRAYRARAADEEPVPSSELTEFRLRRAEQDRTS
jgi:DNA-binding FadR family transcriptional regulator